MRHVALLVCTYRRPRLFAELIASVGKLNVPADVRLHVVVADNNPESALDGYIAAGLAGCPFPTRVAHEPQRGYASARNRSLMLALETPATVFFTTDDDQIVPSDWLVRHLEAMARHRADGVMGGVSAERKSYREGEAMSRVSTRNVSFSRRLADENGLGLRFDTSFDTTGHEDHDFFRRAIERGARIVWSFDPVVIDNDQDAVAAANNRADVARASQRNKAARLRQNRRYVALGLNTLGATGDFAKGGLALVGWCALKAVRSGLAPAKFVDARKHAGKGIGRIEGLWKDEVARQDLRRND